MPVLFFYVEFYEFVAYCFYVKDVKCRRDVLDILLSTQDTNNVKRISGTLSKRHSQYQVLEFLSEPKAIDHACIKKT